MKILFRQISLTAICLLLAVFSFSQKKFAYVSGKVLDENENPLPNVSVVILGKTSGISTNDSGYFRLKVAADKAFALVFSYTSRKTEQRNFLLSDSGVAVTVQVVPSVGSGVTSWSVTSPRIRSGDDVLTR